MAFKRYAGLATAGYRFRFQPWAIAPIRMISLSGCLRWWPRHTAAFILLFVFPSTGNGLRVRAHNSDKSCEWRGGFLAHRTGDIDICKCIRCWLCTKEHTPRLAVTERRITSSAENRTTPSQQRKPVIFLLWCSCHGGRQGWKTGKRMKKTTWIFSKRLKQHEHSEIGRCPAGDKAGHRRGGSRRRSVPSMEGARLTEGLPPSMEGAGGWGARWRRAPGGGGGRRGRGGRENNKDRIIFYLVL